MIYDKWCAKGLLHLLNLNWNMGFVQLIHISCEVICIVHHDSICHTRECLPIQ